MKSSYQVLLLVVFLIHLLVFTRIALRSGRGYHLALVAVFVSLVAMTGLRLWVPALNLGSLELWRLLRWSAWAFTALAAVLFLRFRWQTSRRTPVPSGRSKKTAPGQRP